MVNDLLEANLINNPDFFQISSFYQSYRKEMFYAKKQNHNVI